MSAPQAALFMIAPQAAINPPFSEVVNLSHFNEALNSTSFVNSCTKGNQFASAGGIKAVNTQVKFLTAAVGNFNGVSQSCRAASHADYNIGSSNFVIEFWKYLTQLAPAVNSIQIYFDGRTLALGGTPCPIIYSDGSTGILKYTPDAVNVRITSSANALVINTWQHIALCRASGTTRLFVNGVQVGSSYTDGNTYVQMPLSLSSGGNNGGCATGYDDEFRFAIGTNSGIYTANFTPPLGPFPNY